MEGDSNFHYEMLWIHFCPNEYRSYFQCQPVIPYIGNTDDAENVALLHKNQYIIGSITSHSGNWNRLPSMQLLVRWSGTRQLMIPGSHGLLSGEPSNSMAIFGLKTYPNISHIHSDKKSH